MNLGFLVKNLGASQLGYYLSRNINNHLENNHELDIICYTEEFERNCMHTNFSVMEMAEAWGQRGPMIATSISTAEKLVKIPAASKKYFYIWDLEWYHIQNRLVGDFFRKQIYIYNTGSIYHDPSLELICRSQEHADIISNNFNREVRHIIEDFNLNKILEVVNNE